MRLRKILLQNHSKLQWFIITIVAGTLPVFVRLYVGLNNNIDSLFDIKDILFAALAINISNFSLFTNDDYELKSLIAWASGILLVFITLAISHYMEKDGLKVPMPYPYINGIISWGLFGGSVSLSYFANLSSFNSKVNANG